MMKNFNELIKMAKNEARPMTVAVVSAHDEHTLEAISSACKDGFITPVLIGDKEKIKELIDTHGFQLNNTEIINEKDDAAAAKKAVSMIRGKTADFLMKGKLQTTVLLREVVNRETGLSRGRLMSHFGIFELPCYHKLLALTDGGMLPRPDADEKARILMNAVDTLHCLGYKDPKVAVLAASEDVNPKIPESADGAALKKMNKDGRIKGCVVEGPMSFDLMFSKEAAAVKGYESTVTGNADILLMPDMTSGNLLAKAFQFTAGAKMAGMIVGASVPIVLVSRGATAEEKHLSLILSAAVSRRKEIPDEL